MDKLDLAFLKAQRDKPVALSKATRAAIEKMEALYAAGRVFEKGSCELRRDADVYLAACTLADSFGNDLVKHLGGEKSAQHAKYEIFYNLRIQFRKRVGPGKCAVGSYDFDKKVSRYEGLVAC
jgi:hypothetical protein